MAKYDEKVKAECVEMVKSGSALADVSKKFGPNPKAILRYCKKAGVDVPKKERKVKAKAPVKTEVKK